MLGVYTSGISGAHINPAVTFANCIFRKFPYDAPEYLHVSNADNSIRWWELPIYAFAQTFGAFLAGGVVYANYKSAVDYYEGGPNIRTVPGYSDHASAGIFCTYPQPFMTRTGMFFSEFVASTLLMFLIYVLKDDANLGAGNLVPLGLFFIIFGIGACFGWETGYAINLARDFGPRLMSYFLGYGMYTDNKPLESFETWANIVTLGHEVWAAGGYYFWVCQSIVQVLSASLNELLDSDGCSLFRHCIWRLPVRPPPIHGRVSDQYTIHGALQVRTLDEE